MPRALKNMAPRYQRIDCDAIPAVSIHGAMVRVIAGQFGTAHGPAEVLMPTMLWHVRVDAKAEFATTVPAGFEVAAYVLGGVGAFSANAQRVTTGSLVVYENIDGDISFLNIGSSPLEVMLLGGAPAEGPLLFHGPFVMNSHEQIRAAEKAYLSGAMGRLPEMV